MKLLRLAVHGSGMPGAILDGIDVEFRDTTVEAYGWFEPVCLVGPNGAGKSQFLQVLAEVFQSVIHACAPREERQEANARLTFEVEYLIRGECGAARRVRARRLAVGDSVTIERHENGRWVGCSLDDAETLTLLPAQVVGYTSGGNETFSAPFLVSRAAYAEEVARQALGPEQSDGLVADPRLMLLDYGTHLEVLVANLLLGDEVSRRHILAMAGLDDLHSLRCVIQLAHGAAPSSRSRSGQRGIALTSELQHTINSLQACASCWDVDKKTRTYVFDFFVTEATRRSFRELFGTSLRLYVALHKLAMLNDLVLPARTRERFRREALASRFAARPPEAPDEQKAFRFERVRFRHRRRTEPVDYVSLSDGEHQRSQLLGVFAMLASPDVLFLLDEPESHYNPEWRVRFVSSLLDVPTSDGPRTRVGSRGSRQDCVLTTHAPFVPSDLPRERVFMFSKDEDRVEVRHPDVETYGTTFDTILDECFQIRPPISQLARREIEQGLKSDTREELEEHLDRLGPSVERALLVQRLLRLPERDDA